MTKILILHGPNLNLLGTREPHLYGSLNLNSINDHLIKVGKSLNLNVSCYQSNAEFELIERIHQAARENIAFIIINPAAFTHTSIALRDALLGVNIPFLEIHLSNVQAREPFRHHSYFSDKAIGVIGGFGTFGYELALHAANHYLGDHLKTH